MPSGWLRCQSLTISCRVAVPQSPLDGHERLATVTSTITALITLTAPNIPMSTVTSIQANGSQRSTRMRRVCSSATAKIRELFPQL